MKLYYAPLILVFTLVGCESTGSDTDYVDSYEDDASDYELADNEFCPVGSFYDEKEDVCFIDCDGLSDAECDLLEEETFSAFDEFVLDSYNGPLDSEGSEAIARFDIQEDLSLVEIDNAEPESAENFQAIWQNASKILPRARVMQAFSEFHIDSDGESGTLAYVTTDENAEGKWILAFDDVDYFGPSDKEFIHTTIHEFGHVVFLGIDQLDPTGTDNCPTYNIQEGCSFASSHINQFYQAFWTDIIDEHKAIESEDPDPDFYEKYRNRFISEYASTNPVEDAAEVFTHFVLTDKPKTSDTVVNQKILMMHDNPALVKLRQEIRGKLTVTRARKRVTN